MIDADAVEHEVAAYRKAMAAFQETLDQELTADGSEQRERMLRLLAHSTNIHHAIFALTSGSGLVMQVVVTFSSVVADAAFLATVLAAAWEPVS